ncbi:hypothetical protein ACCE15_19215 [Pseudomonas parafulva]|uniref:hypothetical protein n=1 Tax=Pseudomonas parafulva TaxID=157782 RepID=UPI003563AAC6
MKKETTRQRHNRLFKEKSQATKVVWALETGNHLHYDFSVASKKKGMRFLFGRIMLRQFIRENDITDVKEGQFRYRLGKLLEKIRKRGLDDSVLYTLGLFQRSKQFSSIVYLYSPIVLEGIYQQIKEYESAKADKKLVKSLPCVDDDADAKRAKKRVSGASGANPVTDSPLVESKCTGHKKAP